MQFQPLTRHRHLQTIFGTLFRRTPTVALVSETWDTPDGDVMDVDLLPTKTGRPGVIVLHGLESSTRASYVRGTLALAAARGWNAAALNFRSCGPTPHRRVRTYHSGFTDDLDLAARRLAERWRAPIGAVGFSLGGNVLLKWLGENGDAAPIRAAVAVSVPYDLAACSAALDGPGFWARIYRARFLRTLRKKALANERRFPGSVERARVRRASTFADFDEHVTARLFGFDGALDYWTRMSSARWLERIRVPTLLVSAEDDPFIPASAIPRDIVGRNPALTLALFSHGGHVGFVGGSWLAPEFVAERLAIESLAARL